MLQDAFQALTDQSAAVVPDGRRGGVRRGRGFVDADRGEESHNWRLLQRWRHLLSLLHHDSRAEEVVGRVGVRGSGGGGGPRESLEKWQKNPPAGWFIDDQDSGRDPG